MRFLRRVASALVVAVILVSGLRLSGSQHTPMQRGGWRPLQLPPPGTAPGGEAPGGEAA